MTHTLHTGDCREVMAGMDAESVHSIVTDPPYGLSFMGKGWDHGVPGVEFWTEAMRVAKPGAHLLAFGGTRTYHRLACAIEDAGWEIRDCVMWVYGSGFPKSHNLKDDWHGWGTALKPAWEPIIVARKPLGGTVAANVQEHGCGGLNIDGCRVGGEARVSIVADYKPTDNIAYAGRMNGSLAGGSKAAGETTQGRWPANLIHDGSDEVVGLMPEPHGAGRARPGRERSAYTGGTVQFSNVSGDGGHRFGDSGSAARFFYCAKASKKDRDEGCEGLEEVTHQSGMGGAMPIDDDGKQRDRFTAKSRNHHPTVKPTDLMRYLCRLVTPPGGIVLDPFTGSGSTGKAAVLEGFEFIGIEREPEYVAIAERRIAAAAEKAGIFAEAI